MLYESLIRMQESRSRVLARYATTYVALALFIALAACTRKDKVLAAQMLTGGDVDKGRQLIYSYNCGSCHTIPGVAEADGNTGPSLKGIADRVYVAGLLVNSPDNLSRWISEPQKVYPGNAMPDLGVTKGQANDIAAYLYTLR